MKCYNCGSNLSELDFCTVCGADVSLYKKIVFVSNRFYNDGLEKANVRDLSGAIQSLRQSVKFDKNNIAARNLLGLVYFEMGEVVAALSEWVISANLQPKKNIANTYIKMIQSDPTRLDTINQTIKKYNQALAYCRQDSLDLAVIQLKRVLSLNPKFIRAHQLLALLYIQSKDWEKAKRELVKCEQIDTNNTTTLRYLKEVEEMLTPEDGVKETDKKSVRNDDTVRYQSGNETIIRPVRTREGRGLSAVLYLVIGLIIGLAAACLLILPARIQAAKAEVNDDLRQVSEQSDAKTATIDALEQQVTSLETENAALSAELSDYAGTDESMILINRLLETAAHYFEDPEDILTVADALDDIYAEEEDEALDLPSGFDELADTLYAVIAPDLAVTYYDTGYAAYREGDYETAASDLKKAYDLDNTNGDALYYMANSCYNLGRNEEAAEAYQIVIDNFPGTVKARNSATYLAAIQNAG